MRSSRLLSTIPPLRDLAGTLFVFFVSLAASAVQDVVDLFVVRRDAGALRLEEGSNFEVRMLRESNFRKAARFDVLYGISTNSV